MRQNALVYLRLCLVFACVTGGMLAISKAFAAAETDFYGTVMRIVDGDTIHFKNVNARKNAPNMKIRMVGIDTPETHLESDRGTQSQGYWGEAATEALERMLPVGSPAHVVSFELDKYGRVLGRVYSGERDINLKMVQLGWASPYFICSGPTCDRQFFERESVEEYFAACERAREEGRGIYDPDRPLKEMPFEFRLRVQRRKHRRYVGQYSTGKLYTPSEYKRVDLCDRIFFDKEEDARRLGFRRAN